MRPKNILQLELRIIKSDNIVFQGSSILCGGIVGDLFGNAYSRFFEEGVKVLL